MSYALLSNSNKLVEDKSESLTKISFRVTYFFLLFAFVISAVSSFLVNNATMRAVLIIEAVISGVAAFVYSQYFALVNAQEQNKFAGWMQMEKLRYIDWSITTPLMLCSLSLVLGMASGVDVDALFLMGIALLDWIMLYFGFLGETKKMSHSAAMFAGFIPLTVIFYLLYDKFVKVGIDRVSKMVLGVYVTVWSLYGVVYMLDEKTKTIAFNILDCVAKPFLALGLSGYFLSKSSL
jgi:bacteriorhodopsin